MVQNEQILAAAALPKFHAAALAGAPQELPSDRLPFG